MKLKDRAEMIGKLSSVALAEDSEIEISFLFEKRIEIPANSFDFKKLKSLIGKKIGIGNFDGKIFLRKIKSR